MRLVKTMFKLLIFLHIMLIVLKVQHLDDMILQLFLCFNKSNPTKTLYHCVAY